MSPMNRARARRARRRTARFAKFRMTELNLVPLVDTFVSIVFFALTAATMGELTPVVPGVRLPEAQVGAAALQQLTLGVGRQLTLAGTPIMETAQAAMQRSSDPTQPLLVPQLYATLRVAADSIRRARGVSADASLDAPLAIQGDRSMRYDLLARLMQTARLAGFRNIALQVSRVSADGASEVTGRSAGAER